MWLYYFTQNDKYIYCNEVGSLYQYEEMSFSVKLSKARTMKSLKSSKIVIFLITKQGQNCQITSCFHVA